MMSATNICQRCPYLVLQSLDNIYKRLLSQNTIDACEAHVMMSQHKLAVEIGMWKLGCGNWNVETVETVEIGIIKKIIMRCTEDTRGKIVSHIFQSHSRHFPSLLGEA